jgi:hypothetical protein
LGRSGVTFYDHAINEFGLVLLRTRHVFNRTVVLRYRIQLEQEEYAAATINVRLAEDAISQHLGSRRIRALGVTIAVPK